MPPSFSSFSVIEHWPSRPPGNEGRRRRRSFFFFFPPPLLPSQIAVVVATSSGYSLYPSAIRTNEHLYPISKSEKKKKENPVVVIAVVEATRILDSYTTRFISHISLLSIFRGLSTSYTLWQNSTFWSRKCIFGLKIEFCLSVLHINHTVPH